MFLIIYNADLLRKLSVPGKGALVWTLAFADVIRKRNNFTKSQIMARKKQGFCLMIDSLFIHVRIINRTMQMPPLTSKVKTPSLCKCSICVLGHGPLKSPIIPKNYLGTERGRPRESFLPQICISLQKGKPAQTSRRTEPEPFLIAQYLSSIVTAPSNQ